ncbi:MAG: SRPBCC family protein [Chloroflexi bacterium]|nr:SRPBCC family protein [Chloroflexota bacterium]
MSTFTVSETKLIDAPAERIYGLLADYHTGHPSVLPKPYFTDLQVTQGGRGAGTQIVVHMNVYGSKTTYNMVVTEPVPGRVLQEEDKGLGVVTTFTVDSLTPHGAQVTIATTSPVKSGLAGWLEQKITAALMHRIYRAELDQIARVSQQPSAG